MNEVILTIPIIQGLWWSIPSPWPLHHSWKCFSTISFCRSRDRKSFAVSVDAQRCSVIVYRSLANAANDEFLVSSKITSVVFRDG